MSRNSVNQMDSDEILPSKASGEEPGLLEAARLLERELRQLASDHLQLAALETRRAGESLVRMIAMGVISALLLVTAWLALIAAVVVAVIEYSLLTASVVFLLTFVVHCAVALALLFGIRKQSRCLLFPSTISRLQPTTADGSSTREAR